MKNETSIERLQSLLPEIFVLPSTQGDLFVQLQITPKITAAMPLVDVAEVDLISASEITPIPNMPESVMGLLNSKGYVFWLIDLALLLGDNSILDRVQRYEIIINRSVAEQLQGALMPGVGGETQLLGLAIQHVRGSFRATSTDIRTAENEIKRNIAPNLLPYANSYVIQDDESIPILSMDKVTHVLAQSCLRG